MTTATIHSPPPRKPAPIPLHEKRWTCEQFHRAGEAGLFEGQRAKLIEGVIFEEGPMNRPHALVVALVDQALRAAFGPDYHNQIQSPLVFGEDTDPMPDVAVLPGQPRDYPDHPRTAALVVEVSDSRLDFDTVTKRPLYARGGIAEYWVIDINTRRLLVYRDPRDGDYAESQVLAADAAISPLAAPTATVRVADLLG